MFTTNPHINRSATYRAVFLVVLVAALVVPTLAPSPSRAGGTGYGWPVKPFGQEHPVRGLFGDPRTLFSAPPTTEGALFGGGSFQFHFGIDISVPAGTAVYPVASGTVTRLETHMLTVSCGGGRSFDYWHITPQVHRGDSVTAYVTVLGRVTMRAKHVHFSEALDGAYLNPLQAGHLVPYTDHAAPHIASISVRRSATELAFPNLLRGRVDIVVDPYDTSNLPVPGAWHGMPVAPALLTWEIRDLRPRPIVGRTVAVDFRRVLPAESAFWNVYARGSYQNMSVFGKHYSYREPGRYLYRLTPTPFDTTRLERRRLRPRRHGDRHRRQLGDRVAAVHRPQRRRLDGLVSALRRIRDRRQRRSAFPLLSPRRVRAKVTVHA
jgi:hypothetical protein